MDNNIHHSNNDDDNNFQQMKQLSPSMTTTTDILSAALDECGLGDFFANPVCVFFCLFVQIFNCNL